MRHVDRDIVLRHGLDSQAIRSLDLQAIYADVLDIVVVPVVRIAADRARLVDEVAAVAAVETKERQYLVEIDVLLDDDFLPGRASSTRSSCARIELETPDELKELVAHAGVLVHAKRKGMVAPGAMYVHGHPGAGEARDLVEMDRGACLPRSRVSAQAAAAMSGSGSTCSWMRIICRSPARARTGIREDPCKRHASLPRFLIVSGRAQRGDLPLPA